MRSLNKILTAACFLATANFVLAQTAEEILKKHIEAVGGLEKLAAIKTLKISGKSSRGGGRFEAKFVRYIKLPNMVRNEMEMRGQTMVQAYDGEKAWGIMPFRGSSEPQEFPGGRGESVLRMADLTGPLVHAREKGFEVELAGQEEFEGTEVFKLKVTDKDGGVFHSFIDDEYFLEIKRSVERTSPDGEKVEVTTLFSDFKPVSGIMVAHSVTTQGGGFGGRGGRRGPGGGGANTMTLESIEVNVEIDDAIFKMPK